MADLHGKGKNTDDSRAEPSLAVCAQLNKEDIHHAISVMWMDSNNHNTVEKCLSLICNETLAAESINWAKLKQHLNTKTATYCNKAKECCEQL